MDTKLWNLWNGYSNNYFSLSSIQASATFVSCRVNKVIPKFGYLDPEAFYDDLYPGTMVELPIWAAKALSRPSGYNKGDPDYVSVQFESPSMFRDAQWQVLDNNPDTAYLSGFHKQFYEYGLLCSTFPHKEVKNLAKIMKRMFKARARSIFAETVDRVGLDALELHFDMNVRATNSNNKKWWDSVFNKQGTTEMEIGLEDLKMEIDTESTPVSEEPKSSLSTMKNEIAEMDTQKILVPEDDDPLFKTFFVRENEASPSTTTTPPLWSSQEAAELLGRLQGE